MTTKISNRRGVFSAILDKERGKNQYEKFIEDTVKAKVEFDELNPLIEHYKTNIEKINRNLDKLSRMEEILLQIRALKGIKNVKLSQVRQYVYARTSFYRHDKKVKDIRVIVDKVSRFEQPVEELYKSRKFMKLAKEKLTAAMITEIDKNIEEFRKDYRISL